MSSHIPAGRELDAALREAIGLGKTEMRWCKDYTSDGWTEEQSIYERDPRMGTVGAEHGHLLHPCVREDEIAWRVVPHYSADIAAAWSVFEWLTSGATAARLSTGMLLVGRWGTGWCVRGHQEAGDIEAEADTAPLAICRAALRAVGAT